MVDEENVPAENIYTTMINRPENLKKQAIEEDLTTALNIVPAPGSWGPS